MKAHGATGLESLEEWSVTQGWWKPTRMLLLGVLLVLMCVPGLIAPFNWWSVFGAGFFGAGAVFAAWRLARAGQVVVHVDAEGVDLRPATGRGGFVRWSELEGVGAWSHAVPPGVRLRAVSIHRNVGRTIVIQQQEVACSADEVVAAIRHFWARHPQESEDISSPSGESLRADLGCPLPVPSDDQAPGRTRVMRGGSGRAS